jgi:Protein of unknown function (DUF2489)
MLYPVLIIVAAVIVIGLAFYAFTLTRKVRLLEEKRRQDAAVMEAELNQQRTYRNKSIQIIAQGILSSDQLSLTEGAIRIRVLMDGLDVDESVREEFNAFYQLSDATSHIPILEEWKKLKLKQRMAYDSERVQLESDHKEFVEDAAKRILGREL